MSRFQVASFPYYYRFIRLGADRGRRRAKQHWAKNMTDINTMEDTEETGGENQDSGSNLTEMLTDGFMESFIPGLENLQGRLGELT